MIDVSDSNNTSIFVTDNNIASTLLFGVNIDLSMGNNTNITFKDNNITVIYNNNITIDNNIIGISLFGVYLDVSSSNNSQLIFDNNIIKGTSNYDFYLLADKSKDLKLIFVNNTIIGTGASRGVYLVVSSSDNYNITLTNNSITGTSSYSVELYAPNGNNSQLNFNNNSIIGSSIYSVYLDVSGTNNTNISVTDNNIIAMSIYGVYLDVSSIDNDDISFTDNNITGVSNAVIISSSGGNVSGIRFLNNTINSTVGDGFYFDSGNIVTDISDLVIRGNTIFAKNGVGLNFRGLYTGSSVNSTVEYNRIIASIGLNFSGVNDNSSFDYNWWGVNDINGKVLGFITNNHYILNITNTSSLDNLQPGDNVSFVFLVLNTTLTNEGVENLPYFALNGTFNGNSYDTGRDDSFEDNFTVSYGTQILDASLDDQYVVLNFPDKVEINSTIVIDPSSVNIGENVTISGQLDGYSGDGSDSLNVSVDGNLYENIGIDSAGGWNLTYLTNRTGNITVIVIYSGNNNYTGFTNDTSFEVFKISSNSSIIVSGDFKIGENTNISGILSDENGNPINNANLEIVIDGESYNRTTDLSGNWDLNYTPKNSGIFDLNLIYQGDDRYEGFTKNKTFNVSKLATNSSINIPGTVKVGKSITISGLLTSIDGKPLANASIVVSVGGKTYNVITNSNGVWKLSYTPKKADKTTIKVSYAGNEIYSGFNISKSFEVIGKSKIKIVKISKLSKVGKYKGLNLYSKTYTFKNLGTVIGSKNYSKYFKNWYLEILSKTSKISKYQFKSKSRILKLQVKNLGVGKQAKIRIFVTYKRL